MKRKIKNRAVFLDRDGTLIDERGYLKDPKRIFFYRKTFQALQQLQKAGYLLFVITNQAGIGRGYLTLSDFRNVTHQFLSILKQNKIFIKEVLFCPHHPDKGCRCRKPNTFLPMRVTRKYQIDLSKSFVIGDQNRDFLMAKNLSSHGILVLTGWGRGFRKEAIKNNIKVTSNIMTAARYIIGKKG